MQPNRRYKTILIDPPWPYKGRGPASSKAHRPNSYGAAPSSVERYGSMSIEELSTLQVGSVAEKNAHLYLWVTNGFLAEGMRLIKSWGFAYKTMLTWGKIKDDGSASMKTGYYYRGATEHVFFAVRGSLRLTGPPRPTLFLSSRLPHSVKPPWFYKLVEEQSPGPYLELFARPATPLFPVRDGWHVWGNEVDSDIAFNGLSRSKADRPARILVL